MLEASRKGTALHSYKSPSAPFALAEIAENIRDVLGTAHGQGRKRGPSISDAARDGWAEARVTETGLEIPARDYIPTTIL